MLWQSLGTTADVLTGRPFGLLRGPVMARVQSFLGRCLCGAGGGGVLHGPTAGDRDGTSSRCPQVVPGHYGFSRGRAVARGLRQPHAGQPLHLSPLLVPSLAYH